MKNNIEPLFFTVCDPITELETRILINPNDDFATVNGINIDYQQLAELSILLFAIAAQHQPDLDSCNEIVEGMKIPFPTQALQELINIEQES